MLAPASASAAAHAAAVAPVVSTSSTRRIVCGEGRRRIGANAPAIAANRSSRERRACVPTASRRRTYAADGRSSLRASARARTCAWSNPRSARRRGARGTHVTALASGGPSATSAPASASPTPRHPENFKRRTADLAGPRYANAARAEVIGAGGQSAHASTSLGAGRPHRRHQGGASASSSAAHPAQNGHAPRAQPAQVRGNRTSNARPITRPR